MPPNSPRPRSAAVAAIVPKQIAAGIDVPNNGEQGRESFVLYLRDRLTGLGGREQARRLRRCRRLSRVQGGLHRRRRRQGGRQRHQPPAERVGARHLCRPRRDAGGVRGFRAALPAGRATGRGLHGRALARHRRRRGAEPALRQRGTPTSPRWRRRCGGNTRRSSTPASPCSSTAPTWRWSATAPTRTGRLSDFLGFCERAVAAINPAIADLPKDRIRLHVCWGNYEAPHDRDVPFADIWPVIRTLRVGGFVLPFANPRHAHEHRVFRQMPLADDQMLVAGVIDTPDQLRRAPGGRGREAGTHRGEPGRPARAAGRHRLRLRHLGRARARLGRRGLGEARQPGGRRAPRLHPAALSMCWMCTIRARRTSKPKPPKADAHQQGENAMKRRTLLAATAAALAMPAPCPPAAERRLARQPPGAHRHHLSARRHHRFRRARLCAAAVRRDRRQLHRGEPLGRRRRGRLDQCRALAPMTARRCC